MIQCSVKHVMRKLVPATPHTLSASELLWDAATDSDPLRNFVSTLFSCGKAPKKCSQESRDCSLFVVHQGCVGSCSLLVQWERSWVHPGVHLPGEFGDQHSRPERAEVSCRALSGGPHTCVGRSSCHTSPKNSLDRLQSLFIPSQLVSG